VGLPRAGNGILNLHSCVCSQVHMFRCLLPCELDQAIHFSLGLL
jgi:hypothetical protein